MKKGKYNQNNELRRVDVDGILAISENETLKRELLHVRALLIESERKRREQKKAAQKEKDEIMGFCGCTALLVVMAMCVVGSAPWTAIFIALGILAMMRKVGWL